LAVIKPDKKPQTRPVYRGSKSFQTEKYVPKAAIPRQEPRPIARKFTVIIKRNATLERAVSIKAMDERRAGEQALTKMRRQRFEGAKAIVRDEVLSVQEARR